MEWDIDPIADKPFLWDLSDWLEDGDSINTASATPSSGLSIHDGLVVNGGLGYQVWVSPVAMEGVESVAVNWETVNGMIDKRTARFNIFPQ